MVPIQLRSLLFPPKNPGCPREGEKALPEILGQPRQLLLTLSSCVRLTVILRVGECDENCLQVCRPVSIPECIDRCRRRTVQRESRHLDRRTLRRPVWKASVSLDLFEGSRLDGPSSEPVRTPGARSRSYPWQTHAGEVHPGAGSGFHAVRGHLQ